MAVIPSTHHFASITVPTRRPISISSLPDVGAAEGLVFSVIVIPAELSVPAPTGGQTGLVRCIPPQRPRGSCDTDREFRAHHPSDQTASPCRASPVRYRTARECGVFP